MAVDHHHHHQLLPGAPSCPQLVLLGWGTAVLLLSYCLSTPVLSQVPDPELLPTDPPPKPPEVTSETVVFWGLRLWQVIGIFSMFILAVIITLCCIFKCRIPRTKKEIEARSQLRQAAKSYADTLEGVPPLDQLTEIPGSVKPVETVEVETVSAEVEEKEKKKEKKSKKKKKEEAEEEEPPEEVEEEEPKKKKGGKKK